MSFTASSASPKTSILDDKRIGAIHALEQACEDVEPCLQRLERMLHPSSGHGNHDLLRYNSVKRRRISDQPDRISIEADEFGLHAVVFHQTPKQACGSSRIPLRP